MNCEACGSNTVAHHVKDTFICDSCWGTPEAEDLLDKLNVVYQDTFEEEVERTQNWNEVEIPIGNKVHLAREFGVDELFDLYDQDGDRIDDIGTKFSTVKWYVHDGVDTVYVTILSELVSGHSSKVFDMTLVVCDDRDRLGRAIERLSTEDRTGQTLVTDGGSESDILAGTKLEDDDEIEMPDDDPCLILNGSPRYHHKTTNLIEIANDTPDPTIFIADQHQLAREVCYEHLGDGPYGVDASRVVWVKGKERACPGCDHDVDDGNWMIHERAARKALEQHDVVTPEVFSDVCPYVACKIAAKHADWVVTVAEMLDRIDFDPSEYNIISDEESTHKSFLPKESKLFTLGVSYSSFDPRGTIVQEDLIGETDGLDFVIDKISTKIESLDRVPKRYLNIQRAAFGLRQFYDSLEDNISLEDPDKTIESIKDIGLPDVEVEGTKREVTKTFEYLRKNFGRTKVEPALEAMLANPKIHAERSQDKFNVYLIPDPKSDILVQRSMFEECKRLLVVGDVIAQYFIGKLYDNPAQYKQEFKRVDTENLDIVVLEGNEMNRRGFATKLSKELTKKDMHNLLIAGSGTRAAQAKEHIGPSSYLFRGQANLTHYDVAADADWSVISYMGSRLTRGIDVNTQITVVRSSQFASPRWQYYPEDDEFYDIGLYENYIETHNAMLRGAGQGEQHVAVIPAIGAMFFDLYEYVTSFDVGEVELSDVLDFIMGAILEVPDDFVCEVCGRRYMNTDAFLNHECEGSSLD